MTYDLLIKGGEVLDPGQNLRGKLDIAIQGAKIAAIEPDIPEGQAAQVLDAKGKLVTPGLIDLHAHVAWGFSGLSVDPDVEAAKGAVTTHVDAGTVDAGALPGFRRFIIDAFNSRVFVFLRIPWQQHRFDAPQDPRNALQAHRGEAERAIEENPDVVLGLKAYAGYNVAGDATVPNMIYAREVADRHDIPIMVHISTSPPDIDWIVSLLKEGDILSHCFTGHDQKVVDMYGKIRPAVKEARERGVILDIGHGGGSFSFKVAQQMLDQGEPPDVISTDLHTGSVNGPVWTLVTTLNKFLALGMSLEDVILRATAAPAKVINRLEGLGALKVGGVADVSILRYEEGPFELVDCHRVTKKLDKGLVPDTAVCRGKVLG
ncbi:MAG: amidohydrolase/deacetylase family metallohydrolase [Chloroflexi bacterium]|nr:amidohydrolase/deacetylase family metallohydrolase [Chloroflexota bacterium]